MRQTLNKHTGRDYLEKRSEVAKRFQALAASLDILIVDDRERDQKLILSTLRLIMGATSTIRSASNRRAMLDAVKSKTPSLIFLDDLLHAERAETTIPALRNAGYLGPIVMISGLMTRIRRVELSRIGVADIVHKDDLNTSRLKEAVLLGLAQMDA